MPPAANAGRDRFVKYKSEFKGRKNRYQTSEGFLTQEGHKKYSSVIKDPSLKKVLDDDYTPHSIKKMTNRIQKSKDLNELDKTMYSLYDTDWEEVISGDTKTRELYNKADSLLKSQTFGEEEKDAASFVKNRLEERWSTAFINDVLAYAYNEKRNELKR